MTMTLYEQLCDWSNLWQAWENASYGKRRRGATAAFELYLGDQNDTNFTKKCLFVDGLGKLQRTASCAWSRLPADFHVLAGDPAGFWGQAKSLSVRLNGV